MWPIEDSTTYPEPRYPPMVRAFAGDSTMTNLCATYADSLSLSGAVRPGSLTVRPITVARGPRHGSAQGDTPAGGTRSD